MYQQNYDYEFVPDLDLKYECPICYACLKNTVQTSCGHLFCEECILGWLNKKGNQCPIDKCYLTEENIFPDNHTRREIQTLKVKCPYSKNGCNVIAELGTIKHHELTCDYVMEFCSLGCGSKMCRKEMDDHLEICIQSPSQCAYCREEFPRQEKSAHFNTCLSFPDSCKYCNILVCRRDMECHVQLDCPRAIVDCEFKDLGCLFSSVERQYLYNHNQKSLIGHVSLLHRALSKFTEENDELGSYKIKQQHCLKLNETYTQTKNENHFKTESQKAFSLKEIQELKSKIAFLERKVVSIEEKISHGVFHWKIEKFSVHEEETFVNKIKQLKSPPFYTSPQGYRLMLRLNLKTDETDQIIVSLFVHLLQGENDDVLPWPFCGEINLSILDQKENFKDAICLSESMLSEPNLDAFQKPKSECNLKGFGYKEFTNTSILHTNSYLKNDTLIIRAKVSPNAFL